MGTWSKKQKYKLNHNNIDNMDQILKGIIVSNYTEQTKKELIGAIAVKGHKQAPSVVNSVLELAAGWVLNGETELLVTSGLKVYTEWAKANQSSVELLFTRDYLLNLMSTKHRNDANVPILVNENMKILRNTATGLAHLKVIEAKAINYVQEHVDLKCILNFIVFLEDFKDCVPKGDFTGKFCISILHAMSVSAIPETGPEMIQFVKDAHRIAQFLQYIWTTNGTDCLLDGLRAIFSIIASPEDLDPSFCLGAVVQYIPLEMASSVVKNAIGDPIIDDFSMTSAVQRMIDWLTWPTVKNIDQWVIMFLKELAAAKKFTILITVTDNKVEQVAEKLRYAPLREASFNILSHMLLSFQHAPDPFHKILPMIPEILQDMKNEESAESQHYFIRTVELLHSLMQLHAGFPDLYDPILDAVKGYPKPSPESVRIILEEKRWSTQGVSGLCPSLKVSERSDTGKTGLFNLGNTCYMNSVLQALYISDEFRQTVLTQTSQTTESLIFKLQQVFAFLSLSQRPAYAPMQFLQASRPSWFTPGFQQDCSEFLKHLLNQLHEQQLKINTAKVKSKKDEKSTLSRKFSRWSTKSKESSQTKEKEVEPTMVQNIFGGKMVTTVKCLSCKKESSQIQNFNDIPLAFPEYPTSSQKTLAGGNSTDARMEKDTIREESLMEPQPGGSGPDCGPQTGLDLSDLVSHYLHAEKLCGENKYYCENCKGYQDGERSIKITKSPEILIFTLSRFSYDAKLQSRSKIFREVRYPKTIALPVDKSNESDNSPDQQQTKRQRRLPSNLEQKLCGDEKSGDKAIYGLSAVIVHSGTSSECGHYYCYARHSLLKSLDEVCDEIDKPDSELDFLQEKWYLCNDSRVSYANYSSFSNVSKRFMKDTPYVLMYRRIDLDSPSGHNEEQIDCSSPLQRDPPIRQDLRAAVTRDNQAYLQEQETAAQAKQAKRERTSSTSSVTMYDWSDKDDDDKGPPGNCGGGGFGGLDSGARCVF